MEGVFLSRGGGERTLLCSSDVSQFTATDWLLQPTHVPWPFNCWLFWGGRSLLLSRESALRNSWLHSKADTCSVSFVLWNVSQMIKTQALKQLNFPMGKKTLHGFREGSPQPYISYVLQSVPGQERRQHALTNNSISGFKGNFFAFHPQIKGEILATCNLARIFFTNSFVAKILLRNLCLRATGKFTANNK